MTVGLAVITGTEDRPHAYVALTRGTTTNLAYVFTASPKRADPAPGPRPAPELDRYDQIHAERPGVPAPATPPAPPGDALAVLAAVLQRDGQLASATQDRHRALTDADHLASLPPGYRQDPGHQGRWLWRTMHAAELAGLDAGGVLAAAIAERDLAGARDPASVIHARLRHRTGSLIPLPAGPWSAQVPALADPERRAYAAEIAAMMDACKGLRRATPASSTRRCAPPNPRPSPNPSGTNSPEYGGSRCGRRASGSRIWPPSAARSPLSQACAGRDHSARSCPRHESASPARLHEQQSVQPLRE